MILLDEAHLTDEDGRNGLMWAVKCGYVDIVKILAPKLMRMLNNKKETALMIASINDKVECASFLLDEINLCNESE